MLARSRGPSKWAAGSLRWKSLKPWMGPGWGGSCQEACTEVALSTVVEKPSAAGAVEKTGRAVGSPSARSQGLCRAGGAVTHCCPWWRRGWTQSPGWHPPPSRPAAGWSRLWPAPGWRRHAQMCLRPRPLGAPGRLALGAEWLSDSAALSRVTSTPTLCGRHEALPGAQLESRQGLQKLELG